MGVATRQTRPWPRRATAGQGRAQQRDEQRADAHLRRPGPLDHLLGELGIEPAAEAFAAPGARGVGR